MACLCGAKEHKCERCSVWFAVVDIDETDLREDHRLCRTCAEDLAIKLGPCPCGRPTLPLFEPRCALVVEDRSPDGRSPLCVCDDGDGAEHRPDCVDYVV